MGIRLAVIEDEHFTRVMLANALQSQGFTVEVESDKPGELLAYLATQSLDAAVLDLHIGSGPTGLDLAVAIRRIQPNIGIVILTSYEDPRLLKSNLPAMPRGTVYLTKREITDVEVLKASISQAIRASTDPGQTIARVTLNEPLSSLTDNQIELLRLMAKGLSNAEIAKQRFVNEKSVEASITRLAKTLRVERTQSQNQRVHMAKTYFRALGMNLADEG